MKALFLAVLALSVFGSLLSGYDRYYQTDSRHQQHVYKDHNKKVPKSYKKKIKWHKNLIRQNDKEITRLMARIKQLRQENQRHYSVIKTKQPHNTMLSLNYRRH